jgi:hypothetical protein
MGLMALGRLKLRVHSRAISGRALCFRIEIAIDRFKRYKSSGTDKIQISVIQARGTSVRSKIYELVNSVWNKKTASVVKGVRHCT